MSYVAFQLFVIYIEPWIRPEAFVLIWEPLDVEMIVDIAFFPLAHGLGSKLLTDRFGVGTSTIRKCADLVYDVLYNEQISLPNMYLYHTY